MSVARAGAVISECGSYRYALSRVTGLLGASAAAVVDLLTYGDAREIHCLGRIKDGKPRHPLYIAATRPPPHCPLATIEPVAVKPGWSKLRVPGSNPGRGTGSGRMDE